MTDVKELDKLIHQQLIPTQQMFRSYELLATNPNIHIAPKVFKKCYLQIQIVIDIARGLPTKE